MPEENNPPIDLSVLNSSQNSNISQTSSVDMSRSPATQLSQAEVALQNALGSQQVALNELEKKVKDSLGKLDEAKSDIKNTKDMMVLGFNVLMVMVVSFVLTILVTIGIFIIQSFNERKASYDSLLEKVHYSQGKIDSYQEKIDSLQSQISIVESLQSPKNTKRGLFN